MWAVGPGPQLPSCVRNSGNVRGSNHYSYAPIPRKKDSKTALVKVIGGRLSLDQVVVQLQRLVPGKWKWEPEERDDGSFVVAFLSKAGLQRSIAYEDTDVWENGVSTSVRLQFE